MRIYSVKNVTLKSVELEKEELSKGIFKFHLNVTYQYEDEKGIHEYNIPKISIPINSGVIPNIREDISESIEWGYYKLHRHTVDLGFGDLTVEKNEDNVLAVDKVIKWKYHEMTIEEIEEKLGYKVKIVGEKGEN